MKKMNKSLIAVALIVGAGSANAALTTNSTTGANDMFLSVYDSVQGKTFNLDLNVTFAQLAANAGSALSAFAGAGFNLTSDANWQAFAAGITSPSSVKYLLADGSFADHSIVISGTTALNPNFDTTVLLDSAATAINVHANEINAGFGATGNSTLINDTPAFPYIGQFGHTLNGGVDANSVWAGWPYDPTVSLGTAAQLYLGGWSTALIDDGLGNLVDTPVFTTSDVHLLGNFNLNLAGNALSFTPAGVSAVPLPAAVWMFGAGLMGVLRANRRKSIQA
jgi:hypothetical protein